MASIVIPNLHVLQPDYERKEFIAELEGLISLTWQNALTTGKMHRVYFDLKKHMIIAQIEETVTQKADQSKYAPIVNSYYPTSVHWPEDITVKQFFIDGQDQLKLIRGAAEELWFYIMPDGIAQPTVINCVRVRDDETTEEIGLILNPFTLKLTDHGRFAAP